MNNLYAYTFELTSKYGVQRRFEVIADQDSTAWVAAAECAGRMNSGHSVQKLEKLSQVEIKIVLA